MVEIEFILRGRTVKIEEVEDLRERAVLKQIEQSIIDRVGGTTCAEHGASPRLTATGAAADSLEAGGAVPHAADAQLGYPRRAEIHQKRTLKFTLEQMSSSVRPRAPK